MERHALKRRDAGNTGCPRAPFLCDLRACVTRTPKCLGRTSSDPLWERIRLLIEFVLNRIEASHGLNSPGATMPERINAARQQAVKRLEELGEDVPGHKALCDDLDDSFFAAQLISYPGNDLSQQPGVERIANVAQRRVRRTIDAESQSRKHPPVRVASRQG